MVVANPNFQEWGIQCILKSFIVRVTILAFSSIILIYNILPTGELHVDTCVPTAGNGSFTHSNYICVRTIWVMNTYL